MIYTIQIMIYDPQYSQNTPSHCEYDTSFKMCHKHFQNYIYTTCIIFIHVNQKSSTPAVCSMNQVLWRIHEDKIFTWMGGQMFHNRSALNFIPCYPSSEIPSYQLTNMHTKSIKSTVLKFGWNGFYMQGQWGSGLFSTVLGTQSHFLYRRPQIRIAAWRPSMQTEGVISLEKFWTNILNRIWPLSSTWILQAFRQSTVQNL